MSETLTDTVADAALQAGGRLVTAATVLAWTLAVLGLLGIVGGAALITVASTGSQRLDGVIVLVAAVFGTLGSLVPCLAGQALGRYIEMRAVHQMITD